MDNFDNLDNELQSQGFAQNNEEERSLDGPDPALTDEPSRMAGDSSGKVHALDNTIYSQKLSVILEKVHDIEDDVDKSMETANTETRKVEQLIKGYDDIMTGNFAVKTAQMGKDQMLSRLRSMRDDLLSQIKATIISMDIIRRRQINIGYSIEDINKILKELDIE